jgi:predicted nucleic acid-binding protein
MARKEVIVDSNVVIAYFHTEDAHHERAVSEMNQLESTRIILTEYVLLEVATLLKQKIGTPQGQKIIATLLHTENIQVLPSTEFFIATMSSFVASKDKHLSFVDTSLLLLSKRTPVITFDKKLAAAIKSAVF